MIIGKIKGNHLGKGQFKYHIIFDTNYTNYKVAAQLFHKSRETCFTHFGLSTDLDLLNVSGCTEHRWSWLARFTPAYDLRLFFNQESDYMYMRLQLGL